MASVEGFFALGWFIENMPTAAEINAADTYELAEMDAWLTNIENDNSHHSAQQKVLNDKPAGLTDGCFMSATDLVHQTLTDPGTGQCGTTYPVASNPRLVAGEPLTMPALKCSLKPLHFREYPVTFTAAEQAELSAGVPHWRLRLQPSRRRRSGADRSATAATPMPSSGRSHCHHR